MIRTAFPVLLILGFSCISSSSNAYPPVGSSRAATPEQLLAWWKDLEKEEATATRALLDMASHPKESVAFLKEKLKPLKIDEKRVRELLKDLGSEKEETWKAAYAEFEYFDPRLAIGLQTLMNEITESPARQRLVEILSGRKMESLKGLDVQLRDLGNGEGYNFFANNGSWWAEHRVERIGGSGWGNIKLQWTRAVRSVVLLQHIGTDDAKALLKDLATGHPDAAPTKLAVKGLKEGK